MPAGPAESFALPVSEPCARFLLSVGAVPPFFFFFFIATGAAFIGADRASPGVARVAAGGLASDAFGGSPPAPPCATASPHIPASSVAVIKAFFIPISLVPMRRDRAPKKQRAAFLLVPERSLNRD